MRLLPAREVGVIEDIEQFREEVRAFIREALPDDLRRKVRREHAGLTPADTSRWMRILHGRGWSCPSWPVEYGGPGWSFEQQFVFERELALNDAPHVSVFSAGMVGPALIEFGTSDQKERFLPGLANGDIILCQGYSEPDAGSDLASLKCRADRDGDDYVINGSKIWTSDATWANWMFGLFRTDSSGRKQHGITLLLVDMATPGLSVRPILTFEGGDELNQVFFENVRVPGANRLGPEHEGWSIGKYILGLERIGSAEVSRTSAMLGRLREIAAREPLRDGYLIDDADFSRKLVRAGIALRQVELTERRFLFASDDVGAEASLLKIKGTEVQQQVISLMVEALGPYGQLDPEDTSARDNAPLPDAAHHAARVSFNLRKSTIWGGSSEVLKNIIAKSVLDLRS